MVALISFMTSLMLVFLGVGLIWNTVREQGAKIVAALAGTHPSVTIVPLPPRPRAAARITAPAFRAVRPLAAAA